MNQFFMFLRGGRDDALLCSLGILKDRCRIQSVVRIQEEKTVRLNVLKIKPYYLWCKVNSKLRTELGGKQF